jgi:predicted hotdog family 3-hydroxylacyl-ACP dehydratase
LKRPLDLPVKADLLVPHRPPMLAIDRLTGYGGLQDVVESTVPHDGIFVRDDGSVEPMALVEVVAQAFAAVKGYGDLLDAKPVGKGFLVEVKGFVFYGPAYRGDRLHIMINRLGGTADFSLAEGKVMRGEEKLAEGKVMVWIPR